MRSCEFRHTTTHDLILTDQLGFEFRATKREIYVKVNLVEFLPPW